MTTKAIRNAQIIMRTTSKEKTLLQKAAEIAGFSNLTNFIMTAARQEANRVLSDVHTTYLSPQDWETVTSLLENPPEPTNKLRSLLTDPDKE